MIDLSHLDMLPRWYKTHDGCRKIKLIYPCQCPTIEVKGKKGQVCGACGRAIPTDEERKLFKV